ncbi:MAG: FKBP-type peptidyl-prolyl cis-trans isomerase [Prevotellaceae bacterium]|nr:FKBP-type peptidyl-prolyl cis-trans isomerase [Prevotellaceae bacterium]
MKKILTMAVASAALLLTACGGSDVKATFNEKTIEEDSIAYYVGRLNGDGFSNQVMQMGMPMQYDCRIDSAHIEDFLRGVMAGAVENIDSADLAYAKGVLVGQLLPSITESVGRDIYGDDSTKQISLNNVIAGFVESLRPNKMTAEEKQKDIEQIQAACNAKIKAVKAAAMEKKYGDYKKENEAYLKKNGKKEGVTTLKSGVQYQVLTAGDGEVPADTTALKVHVEAKTIDGKVFYTTADREQPENFRIAYPQGPLGLEGVLEAIKLMPVGSKWEITVPAEHALAEQETPDIKPFSTLIFTVELVK